MESKGISANLVVLGADLPKSKTQNYTDFSVSVNGKTFKVHKLIMSQCKNLKEISTSSEIALKDISESTWFSIEDYLYSGTCEIKPETYLDIIVAANKLGIDDLKYSVFEYIFKTQCTDDTVLTLLQNAKNGKFGEIKTDELMVKCQDYISERAEPVFQSKEFESLDADLVLSLVKATKMAIDEYEILKSVVRWGEYHRKKDSKSLPETVAPFLEFIRLPLIDPENLVRDVKPMNLFPMTKYLEALEFQIAPDEFKDDKGVQFASRGVARMSWSNKSRTLEGQPTAYTLYLGPLIKSGKMKWSIKVDSYGGSDWNLILGVCQANHGNTFLGDKMGWGWSSHGSKNHKSGAMTKTWDIYGVGDTMTFDLDLTKGTMKLWKNKIEQHPCWTGIVGPVYVACSASASFKLTFV